jgi:hypothetical protein
MLINAQLEGRNTTLGNSLNYQISEQSRDIARENKRDSSAMKAIAVLTMVFLPGTFVAVCSPPHVRLLNILESSDVKM